jgi:thiol-disulfide isomerase/thioredoxin
MQLKKCFLMAALALMATFAKADGLWHDSYDEAVAEAKASGKLLLIDFMANWCGPCRKMEIDVWNKPEIQQLMAHYVPVKLNVDYNRATAMSYGVRGIPDVVISDMWGGVYERRVGYRTPADIEHLLKKYASDVSMANRLLDTYNEMDNKTPSAALDVALGFQTCASRAQDKGMKRILLGQSNVFLNKAKKKAKNDPSFAQRAELFKSINYTINGKAAKSIKAIDKIGLENITPDNLAVAHYGLAMAYKALGDSAKSAEMETKLASDLGGEAFVALLGNTAQH